MLLVDVPFGVVAVAAWFSYLGRGSSSSFDNLFVRLRLAYVWAFVCFTLVCLLISLPFIQLLLFCAGDIRLLFKLLIKFRNIPRDEGPLLVIKISKKTSEQR